MSEQSSKLCIGLTKAGNPCKNYALYGEEYCRVHLPEPIGETKTEQEARLRAELRDELDDLVLSSVFICHIEAEGSEKTETKTIKIAAWK